MSDLVTRNKTIQPVVTKEVIVGGLREMGLHSGNVIEVHSSLNALGTVDGGASTVVDALIETVGPKGTIIMSAYPVSPPIPLTEEEKARGIKYKVRKLDPNSTEKTGMGAISDEFKSRKGVYLGTNFHRVAAWGKNAKKHIHGYKYLLTVDGRVLLIGVGIDRCSSLHIADGAVPIPQEIEKYEKVPDDIRRDYPENEWSIGYGGTPNDAWQKVYNEANDRNLIQHHKIGSAECLLFKVNDVVEILKQWRKNDPYRLYGVEKQN